MFSAISSLNPKKYVKMNPNVYATTNPRKYNKYLLSAINGINDNPDTPIPSAAVFITAWNAPPTAAPKQAVRNGFPSGNVTPYNNGSPIPKNQLVMPFNYVTKSFVLFYKIAIAAPTCPAPAIASTGNKGVTCV